MGSFLKHGADGLVNGSLIGLLLGLLTASSSISWIQSIVTAVVNLVPIEYHFQYISYVMFGLIGFGVGYWADRK